MAIYNSKLHIITWLKGLLPYLGNEFGLLPPIKTLAEMKGCSFASMQKAIKKLEEDGMVVSKHGYGTYLKSTTMKPPLESKMELDGFIKIKPTDREKDLYVLILPVSTYSKVQHKRISDYLSDFCVGAYNTCMKLKIELVIKFIDMDPNKSESSFRAILAFIKKNPVRGIMVASITDHVVFKGLSRTGLPCLVVDHWPLGLNLPSINPNHSAATKELVYVLASLKHKNIALIDRLDPSLNPEISSGYKAGLAATGLEFKKSLEFNMNSGFFARHEQLKVFESLMVSDQRPTAFITYTSDIAIELLKVFNRLGLKVPRDISVVTYCSIKVEFNNMILSGIAYDWGNIGAHSIMKLQSMVKREKDESFYENIKFTFLPGNSIAFNHFKPITV